MIKSRNSGAVTSLHTFIFLYVAVYLKSLLLYVLLYGLLLTFRVIGHIHQDGLYWRSLFILFHHIKSLFFYCPNLLLSYMYFHHALFLFSSMVVNSYSVSSGDDIDKNNVCFHPQEFQFPD
jgi:hypothetical protein